MPNLSLDCGLWTTWARGKYTQFCKLYQQKNHKMLSGNAQMTCCVIYTLFCDARLKWFKAQNP